ncbi:hypothetical protein [Bacillus cereus]|uniref:hypothetical protein n=1 Tax=Bacillus cereus TaxID=1396 RepID=UPI001596EEE8|nr:hypothetical protein [Bacillus cereus]
MKLNGIKLHDSDAKEIIREVVSGKKYTPQSLAVAKRCLQSAERGRKRRKLL